MEETDFKQLLRDGITAARAGQKERARDLLLRAIEQNERSEPAWLWLSGLVDDPEERRICLENVLAINPNNAAALAGLRYLDGSDQSPVGSRGGPPGLQRQAAQATGGAGDVPDLRQEPATFAPPEPPASQPTVQAPAPTIQPDLRAAPTPAPSIPPRSAPATLEFDPYGCPYCGGSVSSNEPRCDNCGRLVELRYRKRSDGQWLGWLAMFVALQGVVGVGEAYFALQVAKIGQLPAWLSASPIKFLIGPAFHLASLEPNLDRLGQTLVVMNGVLAALCVALALGLVLRSRTAYFAALFVVGLLAVTAVVGLVVGYSGLLPGLVRLALVAYCFKWLMDAAPAFEWAARRYNPDIDPDLQTDLDYYDQGSRYWDMGMWAKAAAHWQVASRLVPAKVEYHTSLARAYVKLDYMAAALAEADRALAQAPDDAQLRTFRDSLAKLTTQA
jgi:tetratricopeptide (TPR) repeat protein